MELTGGQTEALFQEGWVRLPGAASRETREAALRAINQSLGRGLDAGLLEAYRARSFCPELKADRVITDLLYATPAWTIAQSLLGRGRIVPVSSGQIALAFPAAQAPPRLYPHLDGMHTPDNGVPAGTISSFSMLVGVLLSDVPAPLAGNLIVWPGTHRLYEDYFRRRGARSLLDGMPDVPLPEPQPVTGRAGDIVLCHYQLAHTAGPNTSPYVRYAVYFRLKHADHDRRPWDSFTDIWREWPGMAAAVATAGVSRQSGDPERPNAPRPGTRRRPSPCGTTLRASSSRST